MSKESLANIGQGNSGLNGEGAGTLKAVLKELYGLKQSVVTGGNADTKFNLAAIRQEDTIISALNNNEGVITDVTADISIVDTHALGTITLSSAAAGQTVTLNGKVYTAVSGAADDFTEFSISGDDSADAAALAAAINAREANDDNEVTATAALGVVTVRAVADGTAGNAITLVKNGAGISVSGATLSGGTATGGIKSPNATNQLILLWLDKNY
jgi:phage tail sheath gpL-like